MREPIENPRTTIGAAPGAPAEMTRAQMVIGVLFGDVDFRAQMLPLLSSVCRGYAVH